MDDKDIAEIMQEVPEIQKVIEGANCRIVILKRFIIALTIISFTAFLTLFALYRFPDQGKAYEMVSAWILITAGIGAYYFKALTDEKKTEK